MRDGREKEKKKAIKLFLYGSSASSSITWRDSDRLALCDLSVHVLLFVQRCHGDHWKQMKLLTALSFCQAAIMPVLGALIFARHKEHGMVVEKSITIL